MCSASWFVCSAVYSWLRTYFTYVLTDFSSVFSWTIHCQLSRLMSAPPWESSWGTLSLYEKGDWLILHCCIMLLRSSVQNLLFSITSPHVLGIVCVPFPFLRLVLLFSLGSPCYILPFIHFYSPILFPTPPSSFAVFQVVCNSSHLQIFCLSTIVCSSAVLFLANLATWPFHCFIF